MSDQAAPAETVRVRAVRSEVAAGLVSSPPHVAASPPRPTTEHQDGGSAPGRKRWPIWAALGATVVGLVAWKGLPMIHESMTHISTDDAFVAGESTTVASKIMAEVKEVLVRENDYVEKGALLVRLDQDIQRVLSEQKRAEVGRAKYGINQLVGTFESAGVELTQARNQVRSALANLHEAYRAVESQQDKVRYNVASLRAEVASFRATQAEYALARKDADRLQRLVTQGSAPQEEMDQKQAALQGAVEKVKAAEQKVQQARALLALPPDAQHPEAVPADVERTNTEVRRALAGAQQVLAGLGLPFALLEMDPEGLGRSLKDINARLSDEWIETFPAVRAARARYNQARAALGGEAFDPKKPFDHPAVKFAERELDELELRLNYAEIRAPIAGFIAKKAVNPGDYAQMGQALLTIQPLDKIYVIANLKETQLAELTIGLPVEIEVDAYPGRPIRGRVAGLAPATGAVSSLLPPENATGNFVKVVQRVPVRIELAEPNPSEAPLLVGLSVIPSIDIRARPSGPDAGNRLRGGEARTVARGVKP